MQPEGRGQNLVVLIIMGLATILIPIVQRWLRQRAAGAGAPPRETDGDQDVFVPDRDLPSDEPEALQNPPQRWLDANEVVEEPEPAKPPPPAAAAPADVKPLLQPAESIPARPGDLLERRLFSNRRWSSRAKLMIAKELLERPRCSRRSF